jgi:hypothetical protein
VTLNNGVNRLLMVPGDRRSSQQKSTIPKIINLLKCITCSTFCALQPLSKDDSYAVNLREEKQLDRKTSAKRAACILKGEGPERVTS